MKNNLFILLILPLFVLACSMLGNNSPAKNYKAFVEAKNKKDVAGMKKYLSAEFLKTVKEAAQYAGKTEDELMAAFSDDNEESGEASNEKISSDGKTATIEVNTKTKGIRTVKFVKEDLWKIDSSTDKAQSEDSNSTDSTDSANKSSSNSSSPSDTSPMTVSAGELISGASSDADKYRGRMLTVTSAELWEIQYSMLHIGAKYGSYSSGYIICKGSFSDYMPYATKISDMRKSGKSPGAAIRGMFSEVVRDSGYTQIHLSPCVLSDLEK